MIRKLPVAFLVTLGIAMPLGLLALLLDALEGTAAEVASRLVFGWGSFLARVLARVRIDGSGVATALICLVLFTAGLHGFLRWFVRESAPATNDPEAAPSPTRWPARATACIVAGIVVMFAAGIAAAGLVHQAGWLLNSRQHWHEPRWAERTPAARHSSQYSLRDMGLNVQIVSHDKSLPYIQVDSLGRKLHSWQTAILPYTIAGLLMGEIDRSRPWDDPRNSAYFRGIVRDFLNPTVAPIRDERGYGLSHYAGNVHVLGRRTPLRIEEVSNGASNTILAGEAAEAFKAWGNPDNLRDPVRGINQGPESFGSPSEAEATLLFLDGSVRSFRPSTSPRVLQRLSFPVRPDSGPRNRAR